MARYTDIDKLIAEYDRVHIGPAGGARKLMVEAPIADVAPRAEFDRVARELERVEALYFAKDTQLESAKAEVAREIFQEIYADLFRMLPLKVFHLISGDIVGDRFDAGKERALHDVIHCVAEIEKKYTEGRNESQNT